MSNNFLAHDDPETVVVGDLPKQNAVIVFDEENIPATQFKKTFDLTPYRGATLIFVDIEEAERNVQLRRCGSDGTPLFPPDAEGAGGDESCGLSSTTPGRVSSIEFGDFAKDNMGNIAVVSIGTKWELTVQAGAGILTHCLLIAYPR